MRVRIIVAVTVFIVQVRVGVRVRVRSAVISATNDIWNCLVSTIDVEGLTIIFPTEAVALVPE